MSRLFLLKRIDELQARLTKGVNPVFLSLTKSTLDLNLRLFDLLYGNEEWRHENHLH